MNVSVSEPEGLHLCQLSQQNPHLAPIRICGHFLGMQLGNPTYEKALLRFKHTPTPGDRIDKS